MRYFSWSKLLWKFQLHPVLFLKFMRLPRSYKTFKEWREVDDKKTDITAKTIGCRAPSSLKKQQRELMEVRKELGSSVIKSRPIASSDEIERDRRFKEITDRYAKRHACHRRFEGEATGVYCYCKE